MKQITKSIIALLCTANVFFLPLTAQAQEDGMSSEETVDVLTQGQFAVIFANQLGLNAGISHPLTPSEAVNLLSETGVSPFGGWELQQPLTANDLARMIVQALGASDEIDESERDNPGTTAYMDYLKRVYDVDIEGTDPAQAFFIGQSETPSAAGQFVDRISSDPLKGRGEDGELDELSAGGKSSGISPLVSAGEVDRLLVELTPAQGGGPSGQVDDGAQDTTPSAPTP